MNVQEYLQQTSQINQVLIQDPTTLLALTVAWIDPLVILQDYESLQSDDLGETYYEDDGLEQGIHVTRTCFPDIYVHAINQLRSGRNLMNVMDFIGTEIEDRTGFNMSMFEAGHAFMYGIPLPYYGFDLEDPDMNDRDDEWHLATMFGADVEEDDIYYQRITHDDDMFDVVRVVTWSLWDYRHSPLHETLMWAIAYVFGNSGNSSVDYSWEVASEMMPLEWTPENVEFAIGICQEAAEIMQSAVIGLANVYDPAIKTTLKKQIKKARQLVQKAKSKGEKINDRVTQETPNPFNLRWDDLRASTDHETESDAPELSVRMGVA